MYDNSTILQVQGEQAVQTLKNIDKEPVFVVVYHPDCPHCHKMENDYRELAKEFKDKNVEFVAINASKTWQ